MIKVRTTTLNGNGEAVQIFVGNIVVPRKSPALPIGSLSPSRSGAGFALAV